MRPVLGRFGLLLGVVTIVSVASPCAAGDDEVRPYFGFRLGAQWGLTREVAPGVGGTTLQDIYGVTLGVDFTRT